MRRHQPDEADRADRRHGRAGGERRDRQHERAQRGDRQAERGRLFVAEREQIERPREQRERRHREHAPRQQRGRLAQLRPYVPPTSQTTKRAGCTLSCVISHCASVVHSVPITMPVSATASGA